MEERESLNNKYKKQIAHMLVQYYY